MNEYKPSFFFPRATFMSCFGKQYCSHTTQVLNSLLNDEIEEPFSKQNIIDALIHKGAIDYRITALKKDWGKEQKTPTEYLLEKGGGFHRNTVTNKILIKLIEYFHPDVAKTDEKEEPRKQPRFYPCTTI